jgi:hypothetical protein
VIINTNDFRIYFKFRARLERMEYRAEIEVLNNKKVCLIFTPSSNGKDS